MVKVADMTGKLISYALTAALTLSVGLLGKIGCDNHKLNKANSALNEQLMQSDLEKGRALTQFGNANKHIDELEDEIKKEIKARDAEVTRYGRLRAKYKALKKQVDGNSTVISQPDIIVAIPEGLQVTPGLLYEALTIQKLSPIKELLGDYKDHRLIIKATVTPYPNDKRDIPFSFGYELNLKLKGQLVETRTPSGAINHYLVLKEVDDKGKEVGQFNLEEFTVVIDDHRQSRFHWWAPHIDIGAFAGASTLGQLKYGGSLGVSFMGFGLTKNDLSWRFPRLSLDLSETPGVGLSPVLYNIANYIPLFSNLWIGPHVTYGLNDQEWTIAFLLSAVL